MKDILLVNFNAKYEHASLGMRCLYANLGVLKDRADMLEFILDTRPEEALEAVLKYSPKIVGVGVYIWNSELSVKFAAELKRLRPDILLVAGGPEVCYETEKQPFYGLADYIIIGEGEDSFRILCEKLLRGKKPPEKLIFSEKPDLAETVLPYDFYSDEDLKNRVVYVESSRGCPFGCEFCLSSLDKKIRFYPLDKLFEAWQKLLDRGLLRFKFTDRTFNADMKRAEAILGFFLERYTDGMFLHFEIVPDRMPEVLFALLKKFPKGSVQLEAGLQTFNPETALLISRRQDNDLAEKNIRRLLSETQVYLHTDLVAGLPGENVGSFASGFDRLYAMGPQEIQVGILKRLRGAPICRHTEKFEMVYSPFPPYEIRRNRDISFEEMRALKRFSRYWDLVSNSGVFPEASVLLCRGDSPFRSFMDFSEYIYSETRRTYAISRGCLQELIRIYLIQNSGLPSAEVNAALERDAFNAVRAKKKKSPKRQALRG